MFGSKFSYSLSSYSAQNGTVQNFDPPSGPP